jgi:peptidylprolyl isomerase
MTQRSRLAISAAALTLTLALLGAACGSDSEGAADTTTTEELVACATAYPAGTGAAEGPEAIEQRGEPEMVACTPDGTLEVIDVVVGTGTEAQAGSTVEAQYVGAVLATGEVFQSSWQMEGAISFPLDGVIQGWSEGLVGMKAGGRRTLVIPAEMAYGANPPPGSGIPANADLVFTIDLVSVS